MLPQCHINLAVYGPTEPVASNTVVASYPGGDAIDGEDREWGAGIGYVEVVESTIRMGSILGKHAINEILVGRGSSALSVPLRGKVVTDPVAIDVIGGVARSSKDAATLFRCPRET